MCTTQKHAGRPSMTSRDRHVLKRVVQRNSQSFTATVTQEFRAASGSSSSTMTVRREVRKLGSHGRAIAHIHTSNRQMSNATSRGVRSVETGS
ncbi:hypothetical protein ANN_24377 [Periplaneta americana]|uniref:Transposase Tc1-like domain-containing protein n=1 Tax=Periplaneta americana TaxID=6978 RepID=A0ABQ8S367_PERAM|nr:hypothetical protein ANN_24377 [Periplaneta americana]